MDYSFHMRCVLTALGAFACTPEPTSIPSDPEPLAAHEASEWGPYDVGATTFVATDPRGKELTIEVWFPAAVPADAEPGPYAPTNLTHHAFRSVPVDDRGAPYSLIAFSHGLGAIRYQSIFLVEFLASHGFVVVAPDHARSTLFDLDNDAIVDVLLERPDDVRFAVDALLERSRSSADHFSGAIADDDQYAVVGHSFGAITSLVLGGAEWDTEGIAPWCEENAGASQACSHVDAIDPTLLAGHGSVDPRVMATVPMAPGLWYAFGPDGEALADVARPLVLGGTRDDILPYDTEARPVYERMAGTRALATFDDAGHYAFSDICALFPFFTPECGEFDDADTWLPLEVAHEATNNLVTAWLREAFGMGVPSDPAMLEPSTWTPPVTLERADGG